MATPANHVCAMNRVVLLAHPRSGSNSLVEVLNRHPEVSILNEPFNEQFACWDDGNPDFHARLVAGEDFEAIIDELFAEFTGIKELSYQLDDECLHRLLSRPDVRVIALRRRNLLQTAVSQLLAEQTGLWKTWDAVGPLEDHYRNLAALDLETVADRMRWTADEIARVDAAMANVDPARVLRVAYEDLYFTTPVHQDALLAELWKFLELTPCDEPGMRHFLSGAVRQARRSTYGRLSNLDEIEARFGDDSTGHLEPWSATEADQPRLVSDTATGHREATRLSRDAIEDIAEATGHYLDLKGAGVELDVER